MSISASDDKPGRLAAAAGNTARQQQAVGDITKQNGIDEAPLLSAASQLPKSNTAIHAEINSKSTIPPLSDNLQVLIQARNDTVQSYAQDNVEIPAALVRQKWKNRHEIYPLLVREEIYGAVIEEIMHRYPELSGQIMEMIEQQYQQIRQQETASLLIARQLAEGNYQPAVPKFYLQTES